MRKFPLLFSIMFAFLLSCKRAEVSSPVQSTSSGDQLPASEIKQGDRPSDSSGGIPGYLTLGCAVALSDDGFAVHSSCVVSDKEGKASLPTLASQWTWHYELGQGASQQPTVTVTELPLDNPYHVQFRFSGLNREVLLGLATGAKYSLSLQMKGQTASGVLGETMTKKMLMLDAPRYRYIRINFTSIRSSWANSNEMTIEYLELKWENQWRQGTFLQYLGSLGPYEAKLSASSFGRNSYPYYVFNKDPNGQVWDTALNAFENFGDRNAINGQEWLKFDFGETPVAIQGIKIDGSDSRATNANGSEGSPDFFYLEGSQDDQTWTLIKGSRCDNVNTSNLSTFEWDNLKTCYRP